MSIAAAETAIPRKCLRRQAMSGLTTGNMRQHCVKWKGTKPAKADQSMNGGRVKAAFTLHPRHAINGTGLRSPTWTECQASPCKQRLVMCMEYAVETQVRFCVGVPLRLPDVCSLARRHAFTPLPVHRHPGKARSRPMRGAPDISSRSIGNIRALRDYKR